MSNSLYLPLLSCYRYLLVCHPVSYQFAKPPTYIVCQNSNYNTPLKGTIDEKVSLEIMKCPNPIFRLQFYNGHDRSKALRVNQNIKSMYPDIDVEVKYQRSSFVTLSNKIYSYLEALTLRRELGTKYKGSIIVVPDK